MAAKMPKRKCCTSKPQCRRCPLRMMAEGTLPTGYSVRKRKLVDPDGNPVKKAKSGKKVKVAKLPDAA